MRNITFDEVFKHGCLGKGEMLLGYYHVVGIAPYNVLVKDWKKKYCKPTTWRNFMQSKLRRTYFNNEFLQSIKNIVWGLGYTLTELEKVVYFQKMLPLIIEIPNSNFIIALAPLNPDIVKMYQSRNLNDL